MTYIEHDLTVGAVEVGEPLDAALFLPEPTPRAVHATVISVDDHLVETPTVFTDRVPQRYRADAPCVVEMVSGAQVWRFLGEEVSQSGSNAIAGRRIDETHMEPLRYDQMRPGCFDLRSRIRDMDINGVWASLSFPSQITGFCGRNLFHERVPVELAEACIRAWNDWLFEEWFSPCPERIIPLGIAYLPDPARAAAEIRRNAARGFVSVSLPERPHLIGLPSLWDRAHWDPIFEACVETGTVVSIHVASTGAHAPPPGSPDIKVTATLFGSLSLQACVEWLWSEVPVRHQDLKIALSEGGIGWVAMLLDRLDNMVDRSSYGQGWAVRPADVLRRNFWFCTLDDPSTIDTRHTIGVENIMAEVDYPHGDGTWPNTQAVLQSVWGHLPVHELRQICCENAATLYRHPLPELVLPADVS
jgi:predicted TIM-barrel fold metal-dependent hydrolase